jgi:hypothetical protein
MTFQWSTDIPGAIFDDPTSQTPKLTIDCEQGHTGVVTLAVSNGHNTNSSIARVIVNHPPHAVAGGPYIVECNGAWTSFSLDGSRSSDPDGDGMVGKWFSRDCDLLNAFGDGFFTIRGYAGKSCKFSLFVSDGILGDLSQTSITVVDTTPPVFNLHVVPDQLPADNRMVPVSIRGNVTDNCDDAPVWKIISVTSSELPVFSPGIRHEPDCKITGPRTLLVRAARTNARTGRVYRVIVEAKDASGNSTRRTLSVKVPGVPSRFVTGGAW